MVTASANLQNRNFLGKEGLVYNIYNGNQTGATVKEVGAQLKVISLNLRKDNKRVLLLTDLRNIGKVNLSARIMGVQVIKDLDFDKAAIFGSDFLNEQFVNHVILASGRGFKIKFFNNEHDAKIWLMAS